MTTWIKKGPVLWPLGQVIQRRSHTQVPLCNLLEYGVARMVKLVDTRDLKSLGHCGCAGSIPAPGTIKQSKDLQKIKMV